MTAQTKKLCRCLCAAAMAALGVSGVRGFLNLNDSWMHWLQTAVLFAAACAAGGFVLNLRDWRLVRFALLYGFAFSAACLLGQRLDRAGTVAGGALWLAVGTVGLAPAAGFLLWAAGAIVRRLRGTGRKRLTDRQFFWLAFGMVMLCWTPVFLAFYPGVFSYDVLGQIAQGYEIPYASNNPLLNTLLVGGLYHLGLNMNHANAGIAVYALIQMLALALAIACAVKAIRRAGCHAAVCWLAVILPAVVPYHSVLAISTTKDPLYTAAGLHLCTLLFEGARDASLWSRRRFWGRMIVTAALVCLLRSNGMPALLMAAVGCLLLCRRESKRMVCAIAAGVMLCAGVNTGLETLLQAKAMSTHEVMSVPIQQMARVITLHPEWKDDADVQAIFQGEIKYNPSLSDPVKHIFRADGETPISQVIRLWGNMFGQHPADCVDATLYLTRGWWDLADQSHSVIYGEDDGYMHTNVIAGYGVERKSLLPKLEEWMHWLVTLNGYQQIPVLRMLFSPALWNWLMIALLLTALYERRKDVLQAVLIPAGMIFTMLLGACCLVRYAYPAMLITPVITGMLCVPSLSGDCNQKEKE